MLSIIVMLLCSVAWCHSQENVFDLTKMKSGHYAFAVRLTNQLEATALLESGIPAMLVDSAFIFKNLDKAGLELILDLNHNLLKVGARKDFTRRKDYLKVALNTDAYLNMPAIRTKLMVDIGRESTALDGNYVIDFGAPSFLFLHGHNANITQWIQENKIELQQARNREGKVVAQAFMPRACRVESLDFKNPPIVVTTALPRFTSEGNLGLKFFQDVVAVFDFGKGYCYLKTTE